MSDLVQAAESAGVREASYCSVMPMFNCPFCKKRTIFKEGCLKCQPEEDEAA